MMPTSRESRYKARVAARVIVPPAPRDHDPPIPMQVFDPPVNQAVHAEPPVLEPDPPNINNNNIENIDEPIYSPIDPQAVQLALMMLELDHLPPVEPRPLTPPPAEPPAVFVQMNAPPAIVEVLQPIQGPIVHAPFQVQAPLAVAPVVMPVPIAPAAPLLVIDIPWDELQCIHGIQNSVHRYPHALLPGVRDLNIMLLRKIDSCYRRGDRVAGDMAIKKLFLLPTALMLRGSTHKTDTENMKVVLDQLLLDDWSKVTLEKLVKKGIFRKPVEDERVEAMGVDQKRSMRFANKGQLGKAYDALLPSIQASSSVGTFEKLRDLHPQQKPENVFAFDASNMPRCALDPAKLLDKIRNLKDLIIPGLSKTRSEHFKQMAGKKGDLQGDDYGHALCSFLQRVANGELSEQVLTFMRSGVLIAIAKTENPDGPVRPITLADDYRKLAAGMLTPSASSQCQEKFNNIQIGVNTPFGTEIMAHDIKVALELKPKDDLAEVDTVSAYGEFYRNAASTSINADYQPVSRYFHAYYAGKNPLYYNMGDPQNLSVVYSEEGGFQGDPAMSLIFSATVQPLLNTVKAEVPDIRVKAYIDDVKFGGSTADTSAALGVYIRDGPVIGVRLNKSKTKILLGLKDSPEEAQEAYATYRAILGPLTEGMAENILIHPLNLVGGDAQQAQRVRYGVCIVGTPTGSEEYIAAWLQKKLVTLMKEAELLIALPDVQTRWLLLSQCFQAKVNHLLRVLDAGVLEPFLAAFEALKRRIFTSIVGSALSDFQWEQATMPMGAGGFGLLDLRLIADAAYFASCVSVKDKLSFTADELSMAPIWTAKMNMFGDRFKDSVPDINDGRLIKKGFQKRLTTPIKTQLALAFKTKVDLIHPQQALFDKVRLISLRGGSDSAAFLQVTPKGRKEFTMSSVRFSIACAMRLGAPISIIPRGLQCCSNVHNNLTWIDDTGIHLSNCITLNGFNTRKHNAIARTMCDMAVAAGLIIETEPNCLGGALRTDVRVNNDGGEGFIDQKHMLWDISITNPLAMSNLEKNVFGETGGLASAAAIEKINKYQTAVDAYGFAFCPIIFETFGAMGKGTKEQVAKLASRISRSTGIAFPMVKRYWMQRLSVVLQCWNAYTIESRLDIVWQHPMNGGVGRRELRGEGIDERYDGRVWGVHAVGGGEFAGD